MKKLSREQMKKVMGGNYQQICIATCCIVRLSNGDCAATPLTFSTSSCEAAAESCPGESTTGSLECSCSNGPGY